MRGREGEGAKGRTCASARHRPDVSATPGSAPRATLGWHQRHPTRVPCPRYRISHWFLFLASRFLVSSFHPALSPVSLLTHANGAERWDTSFVPRFLNSAPDARAADTRCRDEGIPFSGRGARLEFQYARARARARARVSPFAARTRFGQTPLCCVMPILHASIRDDTVGWAR